MQQTNYKYNIGDRIIDDYRDITILDRKVDKVLNIAKKDGTVHKKGEKFYINVIKYKIVCNNCGFNGGVFYRQGKKYFICPDCGQIKDKQMSINTLYSKKYLSCICGDGISYPNKYGFELFNNQLKNQIQNFTREYQPEWAKPYYYDFYFEKNHNKYICEFDGGLGHGKEMHKASLKSLEYSIIDDKIKDKLAKDHGIVIIRIDTSISNSDYISKNILESNLNNILNLSVVDFAKCDEFACGNLVKTICLDYENSNMYLGQLAEKYNLSVNTIISYIKHGKNIGWCSRKPTQHPPYNRKKVKVMFDNGTYEIFESAAELASVSYEKFGVQLYKEGINAVCNGRSKSCKGYSNFEYVTDEEVVV